MEDNNIDKELKWKQMLLFIKNVFQSILLSQFSKLKLYHATIMPVIIYGYDTNVEQLYKGDIVNEIK